MLVIAASLALLTADPAMPPAASQRATSPPVPSKIEGNVAEALSANFSVRSFHRSLDARQVAEHCERWRSKLQRYWCAEEREAWTPRCEVVVHAHINSYLAAVGQGGRQTFGSSLLDFGPEVSGPDKTSKKVTRRLIDFRGDSPLGLAALPHEMTHVILADLLDGRQPPRWADEGMAILADSRDKQFLHERDLNQGLTSRAAFRVGELLSIGDYPHPSRIAAFYGQSASLTACLAKRDDPAKFVEFLRRALDGGYDQALSAVYHIDNVAQLERLWYEQRLAWQSGYHGVRLAIDDSALAAAARRMQ